MNVIIQTESNEIYTHNNTKKFKLTLTFEQSADIEPAKLHLLTQSYLTTQNNTPKSKVMPVFVYRVVLVQFCR